MNFDMKTIVLINLIVSLVNAGVVIIIWLQYKKYFNGLLFLMLDMILQFAGFFLIALRGIIPDLFSIVFGVTFMNSGAFFVLLGLEHFFNTPRRNSYNFWLIAMLVVF